MSDVVADLVKAADEMCKALEDEFGRGELEAGNDPIDNAFRKLAFCTAMAGTEDLRASLSAVRKPADEVAE